MNLLKVIGKLGCLAGIAVIFYFVGSENSKKKAEKKYMDDMMDMSDYKEMPDEENDSETDTQKETDGHEDTEQN